MGVVETAHLVATPAQQAADAQQRLLIQTQGQAIAIVGGLREGLDLEKGGEVAANLDRLYEYMITRLFEANLHNTVAPLDEVAALLRNVKSGWDAIALHDGSAL